jgi:hypothetical protein
MSKKLILTALFVGALCIALPVAGIAADKDQDKTQDRLKDQIDQDSDPLKTKDQIKDNLNDGTCQTIDLQELLKDAGAL